MIDKNISDEIVSLDAMRVQKVFGLFNSIIVMELYSPIYKRLYFIVDQNPATRTMHIQKNRPQGFKTKSMLITLLNKLAVNQSLRFYKLDEEGQVIKACFNSDGEEYSLIFESFPRIAVGLFCGSELVASQKKGVVPDFRRGFLQTQKINLELKHNFLHGIYHEKRVLDYHKRALFEHRISALKRDLAKKETLLKNVHNDLLKCQKNLSLLKDAELLKHNLYRIKRGMKNIELVDYETGVAQTKNIVLDPSMSPQDFLEKIYSKIKRAKRGIISINNRLEHINNEVDEARKCVTELTEMGPEAITLNDIVLRLNTNVKKRKENQERLPYRTYISSDQIKILVGRSAKDSDDLTLHYSRGNEWWFHAADVTGVHVLVKSPHDLQPKTLLEAALLALHFSKAKLESHAIVHYTRAKYVRKPKGMAPGKVLVTQVKAIDIALDAEMLKSLLARED